MASNPGILSEWPWKPLGNFKYLILAPWVIRSTYVFVTKEDPRERDLSSFLVFPYLLLRMFHNQIWISVSRYRSAVIHPFVEFLTYFILFSIPLLTTILTDTISQATAYGYILYIDFMNNLGHCNFELIPKWFFHVFPPLKYLTYTPSFHSLHHTQFRTNYSLFMPMYDYIYGTVDKSSEALYEMSLKRKEELPNVVHLTHMTTPETIYHMRIGFAALASRPQTEYSSSKWYLWLMWPFTLWSTIMTGIYGHTFVAETHRFHNHTLQTWVVPKFKIQYFLQRQKSSINNLIEKAILDAEDKGVKVLSLGLLNQKEELNAYGEVYVRRYPELRVKVVDGSSLAVAIILNSIPKETTQVLLTGNFTKVAYAIALALCQKGIQIWLVGDEVSKEEQVKAPKGTIFIPYSQFPPHPFRKDCFYHYTPAMHTPTSLENLHSCENWLPRRVMSAWRIAGIVHGLEGWNEHECGFQTTNTNIHKVWEATLRHGFQPLPILASSHFKF
ncbi:hypothetical protein F8388_008598 [Cannabis sativa]|uniref:Very-long-chain aldehyde decarbonylase CER1-like C-terminal domain-containing protein n=1 Tax=Cannabis sativa TaxID=3483 RepID=A0A7J6FLZ1_CANSA|nr:hypothetical protein F8388_008598 [Cannabis sativa]